MGIYLGNQLQGAEHESWESCSLRVAAAVDMVGNRGSARRVCCRYPIGGDSQSVTSGVVSRIEVTSYVHGSSELLGMQIDAAINSGNSGGPAFNGAGECVGIAFQVCAW